jgi:uncharacterized protein YjdB
MRRSKNIFFICSFIIFFSVLACTKRNIEPEEKEKIDPKTISIKVKKIEIKETSHKLYVGERLKLEATLIPKDSKIKKPEWRSNNENCAKVDNNGIVNGIKEGDVIITAKADDIITNYSISVVKKIISVDLMTFNFKSQKVEIGKEIQLNVIISPENSTNKEVKWESNNQAIATVNSKGIIRTVALGSTIIKAKCGLKSCTCEMIVINEIIHINELKSLNTDIHLGIGDTEQVQVSVIPTNATNKTIIWTSNNPNIASVNSNGLVSGLIEGETNIIAKGDGRTLSFKIYVSAYVHIPDREFLRALLKAGIDKDNDKKFTFKEAENTIHLNINDYNISDLTGLEAFKNLKTLKCAKTNITKLDVSNSKLRLLDVRSCNLLEDLNCSNIKANKFKLNGYRSLKSLKKLNLSGCSGLKKIDYSDCVNFNLVTIDLSNCKQLNYFYCTDMKFLKTIKFDDCICLEEIMCGYNVIEELSLKNCIGLEILNCRENNLKSLDISESKKLEWIICTENPNLNNIYVWDIDFANQEFDKDEKAIWIKK